MNKLHIGSKGLIVSALQKNLNRHGAALVVDGDYGAATEAAVRVFQKQVGLVVDGIAGEKTQSAAAGNANTKHLQQKDIAQAAERLGVPVATVLAVNEVESNGNGFLQDGRVVILFERHVFYKRLALAKMDVKKLAEQHPKIVSQQAGGYAGGSGEYIRLAQAKAIHAQAALESCSWGLFQIMGYHWQDLGYSSIEHFVEQMQSGEAAQLEAFCHFIEADATLLKALKNQQWAAFAKRYNGAAYERNLYDVKLARAFTRHSEHHPLPPAAEEETAENAVA
jgi:hypothetical protein